MDAPKGWAKKEEAAPAEAKAPEGMSREEQRVWMQKFGVTPQSCKPQPRSMTDGGRESMHYGIHER